MSHLELKQLSDLTPADFENYPVWVQCRSVDYGKPWYEETNDETYRPWTGALPVNPAGATFLISAIFRLADGTSYRGFATPAPTHEIRNMQPQMFVGDTLYSFWRGTTGASSQERTTFYKLLGKDAEEVFPLYFTADAKITTGSCKGSVNGFYHIVRQNLLVEQ